MSITQRCGTGDTGCNMEHDAIQYMPTNMCNGVFAPVCAPEICNVPRIPHHQVLAEGQGVLLDDTTQTHIPFKLFLERTMQVYKGSFIFENPVTSASLSLDKLLFFESNGYTHLLALFLSPTTHQYATITICQHAPLQPTYLSIHATSMMTQSINHEGTIISGTIHLYPDQNVHGH